MSCKRFEDQVIGLAYGELDAAQAARVSEHVATCASCAGELALFKVAAEGARAGVEPPAPSLSNERLRQAILSSELKDARPWTWRVGLGGAALAGLAAVWVFVVSRPTVSQPVVSPPMYAERSNPQTVPVPPEALGPPVAEPRSDTGFASASTPVPEGRRIGAKGRREEGTQAPVSITAPRPEVAALLAMSDAAALNAADAFAEEPVEPAVSKEIVVIKPGSPGATEVKAPNDVAIGG
jgi:hypothetical protein